MADQTGVGAPERDDADPDQSTSTATVDDRVDDEPVLDDLDDLDQDSDAELDGDADLDRHAELDGDADLDRHADGEVDGAVGVAVDDSVAAAPVSANGSSDDPSDSPDRTSVPHPSMAARLGLRPRAQLRARRVQRIVRRIDPWSVLKVSLIFYFCVWLMVMVAAVLLWGVAVGSGAVGSLESFIAEFLAFEEFTFNGDQLFQVFALGGLIGVFVATAFTAVLSVLFNLIADLTGGVRFTVVEEESARRLVDRR